MATATKETKKTVKKVAKVEVPKETKAKTDKGLKRATGKYIFATGRRKTAVANVKLFKGDQKDSVVNKKAFNDYFSEQEQQDTILKPLALTGLAGEYCIIAHVTGGGRNSQVEAVRHGIAQGLAIADEELRGILKKNGFLTRDDRKKERKKPGLKGARKRPQWAKR